nr:hypothetical protein [Microcystis aeruginosa BS13-10]
MGLISRNLPASNYYASSSYNSWLTPIKAFDGDYTGNTGYWNSGYYATKWIEVDLGQEYYLDSIKLLTAQGDQSGHTTHEIRVSNQSIGWSAPGASLVKTFNGYTTNNQWLQDNFSNFTTARYVQVKTVRSPSWIAWLEVEVYGDSMVAPTLTDVNVVPSVIYEGDTVSVNLAATDKNPETISFLVDGKLMGTDTNKSGVRSLNNVSLGKYLDEGTYSFTTQAQDSSGRFSNSVVKNFTVLNVAPKITSLTGNITIDYGKPFNFSATAFDPGINDILTYEWDLNGDGLYDNFVGTSGQYLFDAFDKKSSFTVGVKVSDGDGGVTFGSFNVNINPPIPGVLAFSTPTYSITENGTPITQVIVNRTGGSDTEVSATITVNNGTATADDYNNTPIKVTFAHGDSAPKVITIPIKEDSQFEAVETLNLSLINPTNGVTIGSQNTAIVKIIDNDNFVFTNTDIQPTKLEQLTLPIPTALKQYETLSSELDKAKVKLDTTEEQLTLANDDYSFAKETFAGSLSKQKSLTETLQNLGNKKTALTSSFTQSKTQIEQKLKDIQKNIDNASTRLKAETNAGLKDGIQKEINGYLIQIQEQQNLLSIATTRYDQELGVIDFQISESNQDLQALTSNIIPKQVEELEKKNQALVDVKTAWEANKQAVTVADKALGDFLTDYAFLKTQDYSSKFLQDTVNSLNQKISNLQTNLTSLKNSNGSSSQISALEKAILEKQKIVGEVQDYGKTVLAGEVEFKQELETRKTTSADHLASVKVALGSNNIESYVTLSSQLANQLKGLTTVWVDDLQDNHNLTIKVWNGLQAESQAFDSLTSYIDENLATPYGDYYLNEIQLDEALQIRESTVRRRDALADSVNFVTDALFLAKKQLQEYQDLAKLGQHYSDLTKYEKQYALLTSLRDSFTRFFANYSALSGTYNNLDGVDGQINYAKSRVAAYNPKTRPETGNLYFLSGWTRSYWARDWAVSLGGNLVTVNDIQEQFWITDNFGTNFWIGLYDHHNHNGPWYWFSGEPYQYESWQWIPGEPNDNGGEIYVVSLGRANGWNDIDWEDSRQGLVEINLKPLYDQRKGVIQTIKDANVNALDALKSLNDLLSNNELASLFQGVNIGFVKSYLQKYNEIFSQSQGIIDEATLKRFQNEVFTPLSQAYSQLATGSSVEGLIGNNRPFLISNLNQELTNKAQDLVVQIDLTNDQQEQGLEPNLQKYIEQKQNSIVKAQEAPLTAIRETFQQPTRALYFDGVNDYIQINLNEPETEVTHELWFKTTSLNGGLFSVIAGSGGHDRSIHLSNGNIVVRIWNNEVIASSGLNLADGKWHHVAHVFGASVGGQQIYVDGQLVASGSRTISDFNWQDKISIGYSADSGYFKGEIDEVRVWNVAKTQAQIQTYYNRNLTGKEQGLAGYWKFDETSGNTVNDLSSNNNNATLINGIQRTVANSNPITRPEGKALYFDGVNDYINAGVKPSLELSKTFTIEAWINPQKQIQQYGGIIVNREGEYQVIIGADGTLVWAFANSSPGWTGISTGYVVKTNEWTHIAISYDNGLIKTYANGLLVHTYDGAGSLGDAHPNEDEFRIGYRQAGFSQYFKGQIDEVRIWNVTKTQAEIQANLNQKLTGNEQGLAGYWNFEEATGNTVNDLTANKNNGTLINGIQRTVANSNSITQPEGKALYFDGVNDYVQVGEKSSLVLTDKFTLEAWINPIKGADQGIIINKEGEYEIARFSDGTIRWYFWANPSLGNDWINTGYIAPENQWTHVALTYDKNIVKIYANGELIQSYETSVTLVDGLTTWNDFRIGGRQGFTGTGNYFKGQIDEVRVWNITRTQSEIQANLNQKLTGNEQGLVGYWNFEETTGNTVNDLTANKNNGTLINGVQRTVENTTQVKYQPSNALYFDGINDSVKVPNSSSLNLVNQWTLEAWIFRNTTGRIDPIIEKYNWQAGFGGFNLRVTDTNKLIANVINGVNANAVESNITINSQQWYHVSATFDGSQKTLKLYVNGVLVGVNTDVTITPISSNVSLKIGERGDDLQPRYWYFNGQIDDVRVWNITRTQAEIQANLNQKLSGNEQGLAGYWNFEETTGNTVNDLTANKNNGTLINGVQRTVANSNPITRPEGKALFFDGVNDSVKIADSPNLNPTKITIEAWVKSSNWAGQTHPAIVAKGINEEYLLWKSNDAVGNEKFAFRLGRNIVTVYGSTTVQNDVWYHVAATYDGNEVKLYVNGSLEGIQSIATVIPDGVNPVTIGGGVNSNYLRGNIDEVRIWNVARTQAEIQASLNQKLSGNEQGLVGYWNFEETTGNTVNDLTANKNNGTLINGVQRTIDSSIAVPQIVDGQTNLIESKTIANLQTLRLETAYLTLQAQQNPDKVQSYLQTYNSLKILGTTENQGTDLSLFDIVTPQGDVYQWWTKFDDGANIIPGDFNGDGKTDFIRQEKNAWDNESINNFNIYFSRGDGYFDLVTPQGDIYQWWTRFDDGANIISGDFNGDGKTDFIRQEKNAWDNDSVNNFNVYFSRGDGYFDLVTPQGDWYQNWLRGDADFNNAGVNIIPGDYNGDGKTD